MRTFSIDHVLIGAFALVSALTMAVIDLSPSRANSAVAVVFAPWTTGADAVRRVAEAGGLPLKEGRYPFIMLVRPGTPGFASAVRKAGALMLLDAAAVRGCLPAVLQ